MYLFGWSFACIYLCLRAWCINFPLQRVSFEKWVTWLFKPLSEKFESFRFKEGNLYWRKKKFTKPQLGELRLIIYFQPKNLPYVILENIQNIKPFYFPTSLVNPTANANSLKGLADVEKACEKLNFLWRVNIYWKKTNKIKLKAVSNRLKETSCEYTASKNAFF